MKELVQYERSYHVGVGYSAHSTSQVVDTAEEAIAIAKEYLREHGRVEIRRWDKPPVKP